MSTRFGFLIALLAASLVPAGHLPAQQASSADARLAKMVTDAGGDADKLLAAAKFAKANKLDGRATEILEQILAADPDCKKAHAALGHKLEDGTWYAELDGLKVPASEAADARRGIYHHDGERVTRWEKERLEKGYVRHPSTQLLVAPEDADKAKAGQFPLGDGKWGDLAAADKLHGNMSTPWIVRTRHLFLVTPLPYTTIRKELWPTADSVYPTIATVCGRDPDPDGRPVLWILPTTADYRQFGDDFGDENSSHGAFFADPDQYTIAIEGKRRPVAAANWDAKGWGPYFVRHGAALALARSCFGAEANALPGWFHRAFGGYAARLHDPQVARAFAARQREAGAPDDLGKWLAGFEISGDNPVRGKGSNDYTVFQAGLLLHFCMRGGDKESTDALVAVTAAIREGKDIAVAVRKLQEVLGKKTAEVNAHLEKLAQ